MLDKFQQIVKERHQYARDWKAKTGGKVVGYLCTYTPEEIMYAAGVLPVRILGSHEPQDVTDPHIFGMYCPLCRDCLAQGLKGRYDYLDGIIISQCCLHMRQVFWSWKLHLPTSFSHYIHMPVKVQSARAKPFLSKELVEFKTALEEWTGKAIPTEALDTAIETYNTNRRLMKQIYELRQSDDPPISGAEAMEIVVSSQISDKATHNQLLAEALEYLPERKNDQDTGVRLMLVGSENDDTEFVRMVESLGVTCVIDDHCTGSRYFWNEVIPEENRIEAIAARYIDRVPCPSKDWEKRLRFEHIQKLIQDYQVQGVMVIQQKFCDPHELDIPPLMEFLKEKDIPTLFLEVDVTMPAGQFQVRIEAFLEMLQLEI